MIFSGRNRNTMKHRKVEKKSPQTTSPTKQKTTTKKTKDNHNDLKSQPQSFSTILLITILLIILLGVVVLYQSMSTPDNNNETQFITDPLKMEKRAEKSAETSNTSERDINKHPDEEVIKRKSKDTVPSANQEKDGEVIKTKSKEPVPSANQKKISKEKTETEKRVPTPIEEEMKKFKGTIQNHISPKKIFADGRRLPPTELLPQKPNNSSVR
jgi:outer membrane biosynthesis protein TonB